MRIIIAFLLGLLPIINWILDRSKSMGEKIFEVLFKKPRLVVSMLLLGIAVTAVIVTLLFTGPHMTFQPKYPALQSILPGVAKGSIPLEYQPFHRKVEENREIAADAFSIENGKRAYSLYCQFCHGLRGDGNGPVGESYVPRPADLRSDRIRAMDDTTLYISMLRGVGHELIINSDTFPVLDRIVDPQYRSYLIIYVKYLGKL